MTTRNEIVQELRVFMKNNPGSYYMTNFVDCNENISQRDIHNHFDSWHEAKIESGLRDCLITEINRLSKPTIATLREESECSLHQFRRAFGSWMNALKASEGRFEPSYQRYGYGPGWREAKKTVQERDGHACRVCGGEENTEVHHINPVRLGGEDDPENLVLLCKGCHNKFEGKWKHASPDQFSRKAKRF
jgi:hypothetical protein